jgi:hypothetical protein
LWLVHNGIPPSVAFGVSNDDLSNWMANSDARRQWMAIKFSEFQGAEFDLNTMTFKEQPK